MLLQQLSRRSRCATHTSWTSPPVVVAAKAAAAAAAGAAAAAVAVGRPAQLCRQCVASEDAAQTFASFHHGLKPTVFHSRVCLCCCCCCCCCGAFGPCACVPFCLCGCLRACACCVRLLLLISRNRFSPTGRGSPSNTITRTSWRTRSPKESPRQRSFVVVVVSFCSRR